MDRKSVLEGVSCRGDTLLLTETTTTTKTETIETIATSKSQVGRGGKKGAKSAHNNGQTDRRPMGPAHWQARQTAAERQK